MFFGLFHGLLLFPVILSVLGPSDSSNSMSSGGSTPTISFASDVSNSASSSHASSPEKGKRNRAFESEVRLDFLQNMYVIFYSRLMKNITNW